VIDDPFDALFHSQILEPTRKDDDMSSLGDEFLDDAAGFETASTVDPTDDDDDDVDVGVLEQPEEQIRVFLDSAVDNEAAALRFRSYSSDSDVEI
jgi:predicted amidohydrolase YtcJ